MLPFRSGAEATPSRNDTTLTLLRQDDRHLELGLQCVRLSGDSTALLLPAFHEYRGLALAIVLVDTPVRNLALPAAVVDSEATCTCEEATAR